MKKYRWVVAVVALFGACASCTTDYVTGKKTFSLVSESQEIQMGKEADPGIVAEYGVYSDPDLEARINEIGQAIAKESHRPQLEYTFRLLDSPVVNAFALPGGYVYMTRGILAHFNSEDELAGVLGHEVGHVVARHGAEQISRAQLATLGAGVVAILSPEIGQGTITGLGLLMLKFSRSQESESDRLGVEYSTELGYNAHRMAAFFETLQRMQGGSAGGLGSFLSTHPDPGDREVKVHQLADEWQGRINFEPLNKNPDDYYRMIDGIVYGDDPRQGFREGSYFYHPELRFQFFVPTEWQLVNSPSTVLMVGPDKTAGVRLQLAQGSPSQAADRFVQEAKLQVLNRETRSVNGFPATIVEGTAVSATDTMQVLSYFIQKDDNVYAFYGVAPMSAYAQNRTTFTRIMGSFKSVSDRAILSRQPERLRVKPAPRSGTLRDVLQALGVAEDRHDEMALINGRDLSDRIERNQLIKTAGQ